ncbi:hypothetical protein [Demequina mangrovi]|uniref:Uncharacterized protein n=1 Tax=Demequina mangrovi TaxID=1043493 RepID=A0A1H6Z6Q8_9MICO|nr:hypothetical protein [Demequina mangrovi]SEJ45312.1 hypothetical protein SAMN05421637_1823 [Demequina mangrovi]
MRRPASAPIAASEIELQPRHWKPDETLPPLVLTPPRRGGWTLDRAAKAARTYALDHDLGRAGARAAFRAIADAVAPGASRPTPLARAEIRARLAGRDVLAL